MCVMASLLGSGIQTDGQTLPREVRAQHTSVELIAGGEGFDAQGEMWVGIRFRLDPEWHVYWQNPGDSGAPPTVTWRLPQGVTAGEFTWPTPERIPLGPIVNYGYMGDVVLPVRLTARPAAARARDAVGADLKWLVCHEICVPGKASLRLALPLSAADRAQVGDWRRRIDAARASGPKRAPPGWRAEATSLREEFVVRITMAGPAGPAVFFPVDAGLINESAPQGMKTEGRMLEFRLKKSDQLTTEPKALKGVVALKSGASYVVTAPVRPAVISSAGEE
jgi:thiol:disulfide interchange protein DsbD